MAECSLENCNEECFEDEDKCILHCEKNDKNNWYIVVNDTKKWDDILVKTFWEKIRFLIKNTIYDDAYNSVYLSKIYFPKFEDLDVKADQTEEGEWDVDDWNENFYNKEILGNQTPSKSSNLSLNFTGSFFLDKVDLSMYKFEDYINFNKATFYDECNFNNTKFESVSFDNATFHKNISFKGTTFYNNSGNKVQNIIFRKTVFNEVTFDNCIVDDNVKFILDSEAKSLNILNMDLNCLLIVGDIPKIKIQGDNTIGTFSIHNQKLKTLLVYDMTIKDGFVINQGSSEYKIDEIDFQYCTFEKKVEILNIEVEQFTCRDVRFKEFCNFEDTKFSEIKFKNTVFEKLVIFQKTQFTESVDFNYVTFKDHSIFKNAVVKDEINFENTLFEKNGSFYGITSEENKIIDIDVANRETARIIKDSFEKENNIIEANRFYKLEMKKREDELTDSKSNWFEKLIFNIHGISSNHSQDALLALFWIINIGLIASLFDCFTTVDYFSDFITFYVADFIASIGVILGIIGLGNIGRECKKRCTLFIMFGLFCLSLFILKDNLLMLFANVINPFSIMTKGDTLNLGMLIFKVIIAYLIYQFVVSVRQNTRRK